MGNGFRIAPRCRADILLKKLRHYTDCCAECGGFFRKDSPESPDNTGLWCSDGMTELPCSAVRLSPEILFTDELWCTFLTCPVLCGKCEEPCDVHKSGGRTHSPRVPGEWSILRRFQPDEGIAPASPGLSLRACSPDVCGFSDDVLGLTVFNLKSNCVSPDSPVHMDRILQR